MRTSKTIIQTLVVKNQPQNQKKIIIPEELDIFRMSIQIAPELAHAINIAAVVLPYAIVNSDPIPQRLVSAIHIPPYGMMLALKATIDSVGNAYLGPSDTLIFDRRGQDSYMTDNLYIASYDTGSGQFGGSVLVNIMYEGYVK